MKAYAPRSLSRALANSSTVMFFQMDTTRAFGVSNFKAFGFTCTAFWKMIIRSDDKRVNLKNVNPAIGLPTSVVS